MGSGAGAGQRGEEEEEDEEDEEDDEEEEDEVGMRSVSRASSDIASTARNE